MIKKILIRLIVASDIFTQMEKIRKELIFMNIKQEI